jgi:hypothetical protein
MNRYTMGPISTALLLSMRTRLMEWGLRSLWKCRMQMVRLPEVETMSSAPNCKLRLKRAWPDYQSSSITGGRLPPPLGSPRGVLRDEEMLQARLAKERGRARGREVGMEAQPVFRYIWPKRSKLWRNFVFLYGTIPRSRTWSMWLAGCAKSEKGWDSPGRNSIRTNRGIPRVRLQLGHGFRNDGLLGTCFARSCVRCLPKTIWSPAD